MNKTKRASNAKIAAKAIQYWQNKTNSHEVDYEAVRKFIKEEKILDNLQPISVDNQLDALLHQVVRTESFVTERGRRVRKYGIPRYTIGDEVITLPPQDMRYIEPELAKAVFDANYNHGTNVLKRVAVEEDEYKQYSLFDEQVVERALPERNWNLEATIAEARASGLYDDSFDESELDDE